MNQVTRAYLQTYIQALHGISTAQQVYDSLSDWHFAVQGDLSRVTDELNSCLALTGMHALVPRLATTAVGQLSGDIVVVSTNPGYSGSTGFSEDAYRRQNQANNARFCRDFFTEFVERCGTTSRYWSSVMRLLGRYRDESPITHLPDMWEHTSQADALGGIYLVPFRSRKDGITPLLRDDQGPPLLRKVAMASLAMALRLGPTFLIVASRLEAALIQELFLDGDILSEPGLTSLTPMTLPAGPTAARPYRLIRAWEVTSRPAGRTIVVSIPYNIFSDAISAQTGYDHGHFAAILRSLRA